MEVLVVRVVFQMAAHRPWYRNNNMNIFKKEKIEQPLDLDKIFDANKEYFELLLVKDFVGYIPKEISEPSLKIFQEHGEMFERWILWQSWYINRKALNDPLKIPFYNGMMVYLKVLYTMARLHKQTYKDKPKQEEKVE